MAIYLSFYIISILFYIFYNDRCFRVISNQIIFLMCCLILMCFAGFRYGIATDYWSYYGAFNEIGIQYTRFEPGFKFLIQFYKVVFNSNSYNGFVFFIAFLAISIKYLYFIKLNNPFLALIIYIANFYFILEYNGIRLGLAYALIFHAVYWAAKRKMAMFFILAVLASSIHISLILYCPLYVLFSRKISITKSTVLIFLITILFIRFFLMENVLPLIRSLLSVTGNTQISQLTNYLSVRETSIFNMGLIRRAAVIILFLLLHDEKKISNCYFHLYLIGTSLFILFMGHDIVSYRMSLTFDGFMIPLFADFAIRRNYKNIFLIILLLIVLFVLYWTTIKSEGYVLPYQTYIFD